MELEYMLIDGSTGLIYGPYETFNRARERAEDLAIWEILNRDGDLVDWSPEPPPAGQQAQRQHMLTTPSDHAPKPSGARRGADYAAFTRNELIPTASGGEMHGVLLLA